MCASEPNRCVILIATETGGLLDASSVQTSPHLTITTTSEGGFFVLLEARHGACAAYLGGGSKNCQQEAGKEAENGGQPMRVGVSKQLWMGGPGHCWGTLRARAELTLRTLPHEGQGAGVWIPPPRPRVSLAEYYSGRALSHHV